jgi:hypothetical protein
MPMKSPTRRRKITPKTTIKKEVMAAFDAGLTMKLSAIAKKSRSSIFVLTVGQFADIAARLNPPTDVWKSAKFRKFIFGVVKEIAHDASKNTKSGQISGKTLNQSAVRIMSKYKKCGASIKKGQVIFPDVRQGLVCSAFLDSQT